MPLERNRLDEAARTLTPEALRGRRARERRPN
jgi:hypothetical protein